jgi:hypothetical protein
MIDGKEPAADRSFWGNAPGAKSIVIIVILRAGPPTAA